MCLKEFNDSVPFLILVSSYSSIHDDDDDDDERNQRNMRQTCVAKRKRYKDSCFSSRKKHTKRRRESFLSVTRRYINEHSELRAAHRPASDDEHRKFLIAPQSVSIPSSLVRAKHF